MHARQLMTCTCTPGYRTVPLETPTPLTASFMIRTARRLFRPSRSRHQHGQQRKQTTGSGDRLRRCRKLNLLRRDLLRAAKYTKKMPAWSVTFVIRAIYMVAPRDRKLLQLFHLRQINNATFITYVYPLLMLIRRLVYKRGFVKHRNSRIPKLRAAYKLQCVVDQINTGPGSKRSFKNNNDKQFATKRAQWSKFLPGIRWLAGNMFAEIVVETYLLAHKYVRKAPAVSAGLLVALVRTQNNYTNYWAPSYYKVTMPPHQNLV
ncbi:60S ribosomal protein L7 [Culex quinquefasciatus]|uniref:60S ribosomal protein L7 n=1 Tax=Culex quinquefasciatus TaxID=7176 RepID=B0WH86_CULQU|nr:60S ribosomal protein L7 [Culex quinquefasciatus]|eukprot:XP_001848051.1 60S ribosomal protein L7 [Culex quinquefasciatus]